MTSSKLLYYGVAIIGIVIAIGIQSTPSSSSSPYYPMSWCSPLQPIAVMYQTISILGLSIVGGKDSIVNPLPIPTNENSNKIAIVTGSNTGIGYETAKTLVVEYGWDVILACRNTQKAMIAMLDINEVPRKSNGGKAIVLEQSLDLSKFGSIQLFVEELQEYLLSKGQQQYIDVLINNAGVGKGNHGNSGRLDFLFQSNFLGHFFLTRELINAAVLRTTTTTSSSADTKNSGHVINLSSVMHHFVGTKPLNQDFWKSMALYSKETPPETYAASKLAAILFSQELMKRYNNDNDGNTSGGLLSTAVNPGAASSDIWRNLPEWIQSIMKIVFLTPEEASRPVVFAAVQPFTASLWKDNKNNNRTAVYIQPYWQLDYSRPPFPVMEFLGPYIGYAVTTPRLPNDGGVEAGSALWKVSEELTSLPYKKR